ncbi:MAG: FAD-dependent oxidoreductase [Deltaproteobacteria bacterium]|nr:FAD-dependent oxidoreductase [Deltaproteobacteria bacterium]
MENANSYDVIIVGCGIAGSVAGALLSRKARKSVLILEAASQIGGRATSFRGEGIKDAASFRKTLATSAHSWVSDRTEPNLETLIEKKMLNGYALEAGGRGAWMTNRGRVSQALAVFNKASVFYPNIGFVWYDHDEKPYIVGRRSRYDWMSDEEYGDMVKVHKEKLRVGTIENAEKLDHVTLKDWVESFSKSEAANEFHYAMGTFQTIINDPALNSAGENIKVFLQVNETGVHITDGSWAFAGAPGHRFITEGFASVVEEAGGDILINAPVKEIMIRDGRAEGVAAEIEGKRTEFKAPVVICTLPPKPLLKLLPESILPPAFIQLTKNIIHTGMVAGQFGTTRPLSDFCTIKTNPRSFYHTSMLIPESEGLFRGNVPLDALTISAIAPTVAPEGKHLVGMASSILAEEAHDKKKVDMVIDRVLGFFDRVFPGWRSSLEFMLWTVGDTCILWRHPEDDWVDVKCPTVEGLYFAGDTYGRRLNEGGIEGAAHSGFICASEISGVDYLQLLPPVFR